MIIRPPYAYPRSAVTTGLVYWFWLDGRGIATNVINPTLSGTLNGTTYPTTGIVSPIRNRQGQALKLDGSTGYVSFGAGTYKITPAFTYSAWVNAISWANAYQGIFTTSVSLNHLLIKSTGVPAWYMNGGSADPAGTTAVPTGQWAHLAMTFDGSNIAVYINGASVSTGAASADTTTFNNTFGFGQDLRTAGRFLNGSIDDLRVYNRALSAAEIFALSKEPYQPQVGVETIALMHVASAVTSTAKFRRTRSELGTRIGSRQAA